MGTAMKKALVTLLFLLAAGGGGFAYYRYSHRPVAPTVTTAPITRGDLVDRVGATGTLQAVTTVQVGTQVSGTIQSLYADFNSLVRKGQVLARLDPSLFQTQIEQARANLLRSQADVDRLRVALEDAQTKLTRAKELSARQLLPRSDLDAAEVAVRSADAQLKSSQAQVVQAQAALNQNQVSLDHTVITAPIDGLVISRNVDVGQTVAASMQAPTLFILAADLAKMQVVANLDESDVGRIRPGQTVTFRVDAYPSEEFRGSVSQVRLQPIVQQNVVTYATVIDVPNPDLRLKPGMTANVNVEIARRANVLRVSNTALRFRPTVDIFTALNQEPPAGLGGTGGRGRGANAAVTPSSTTAPAEGSAPKPAPTAGQSGPTPIVADTATGGRQGRQPAATAAVAPAEAAAPPTDDGERRGRGRFLERLNSLPPDQREQMLERMRARGFDPTAGQTPSATAGPGTPAAKAPAGRSSANGRASATGTGSTAGASLAQQHPQATTIDALFGPLPTVESSGRVWLYRDGKLESVRVRLGITDGQSTELIQADGLDDGSPVVTNITVGNTSTRPATSTLPPFIGGQPGRFGGPGGPTGGGGGGGGNRGGGR